MEQQIHFLEKYFEHLPMGIAVINKDFRLVSCNSKWRTFVYRYAPFKMIQAIPGLEVFDLQADAENKLEVLFERVYAGETIRQDALTIDVDGMQPFWDITLSPLYEKHEVVSVLIVLMDATERVSVQRTLEQRLSEQTDEVERRGEVAESLQDIIGMINSNLPLDTFLDRTVSLAAQRLGAGGCALHQFDMENQLITQKASYGLQGIFPKGRTGAFSVMKPSGGDNYIKATLERRPLYQNYPPLPERLDEISLDPSSPDEIKKERIALRSKFASSFSVPLFIQDLPYGGLVFYYTEPQIFSDEQVRLGLTFADQIAVAIENASLLQEAEQRRKVAESLAEVFSVINSSATDQEIFNFLTRRSSEFLSADASLLYRIDDGRIFQLSQYNLPEAIATLKTGFYYSGEKNQELIQRQPVLITNADQYLKDLLAQPDLEEFQRFWYETILNSYKAYLGIPLIVGEKLFGGLVFYYKQSRAHRNEDMQVGRVIGGYVSLAIENAMLRKQTAEMAMATERNRLARDLHDAVSQTLFSASLIAEVLPKLWERDPYAGREKLEELRLLTRGALSEMRTLLLELRPATLIDMNLADLYRHLANAFMGRSLLEVELLIGDQLDPPVNVKEVFYRIAQEALNNIMKHAGASKVYISLQREKGQIKLGIRDDGCGFDQQQVSHQSLGLKIMGERADSIGARFFVQSRPGGGTQISLTWDDN